MIWQHGRFTRQCFRTIKNGSSPDNADYFPTMSAVAIKLPIFYDNPATWFTHAEAQFHTRGIIDQHTMYSYVAASLRPEVATEICDLLFTKPANKPYFMLKTELTTCTTASEQKRLHQLLHTEALGDRKPTQLLRRMRQLLGDKPIEDSFFLFLRWMPSNVQPILASSREISLDQLVVIVDKMMEVATRDSRPTIANVNQSCTGL